MRFTIVLLSLFLSCLAYDYSYNVTGKNIDVFIDSDINVPRYKFSTRNPKHDSDYYTFKIVDMFEAYDSNDTVVKNVSSIIDLENMSWYWSDAENFLDGVTFNITVVDDEFPIFVNISWNQHVYDVLVEPYIDILVSIFHYDWQSKNVNTKLVFVVEFTSPNNNTYRNANSTTTKIDNAYFWSESYGLSKEENNVGVTIVDHTMENIYDDGIWIVYSHFDHQIFHRWKLGFTTSSNDVSSSSTTKIGFILSFVVLLFVLI